MMNTLYSLYENVRSKIIFWSTIPTFIHYHPLLASDIYSSFDILNIERDLSRVKKCLISEPDNKYFLDLHENLTKEKFNMEKKLLQQKKECEHQLQLQKRFDIETKLKVINNCLKHNPSNSLYIEEQRSLQESFDEISKSILDNINDRKNDD